MDTPQTAATRTSAGLPACGLLINRTLLIRVLEILGLATVKHVAPVPRLSEPKAVVDPQTLQAVIACRHDVLARYGKSLARVYADEIGRLREIAPLQGRLLRHMKRWLNQEAAGMQHQVGHPRAIHVDHGLEFGAAGALAAEPGRVHSARQRPREPAPECLCCVNLRRLSLRGRWR